MSPDPTGRPPTLRERVGGRWAVSWLGYALWFPLSIFFVFATDPTFQRADTILQGFVISTLAYLATGVIMWIASITVLRNRLVSPAPVFVVVIVGGLSWAARSAVIGIGIDLLGFEPVTSFGQRLVYGFLLGAIIDPTTAYAFDALSRYRDARERLIAERVAEEIAVTREDAMTDALRIGVVEQVQVAMRSARVDLDQLDLTGEAVPQAALEALDRVSERGIRKVAHETWVESRRLGQIRLPEIIAMAAQRGFYRWWFPWLAAISLIIPLARIFDWRTLSILVVVATYSWVVAIGANHVIRRTTKFRSFTILLSIVLLGLTGPLAMLVNRWEEIPGQLPSSTVALISFATAVMYPLLSLGFAWRPASNEALDRLRSALRESDVLRANSAERERRVRQEIAVMLHGSLGANLTAVTMRMRHAIAREDITAAREALQEARRLIDVDLTTWAPITTRNIGEALAIVIDPWDGLVEITSTIDMQLSCSITEIKTIVDVVTEGITNAVRHGQATRVDISVRDATDSIDIQITSDGLGASATRSGLGSRIFNQVAENHWSLLSRDDSQGTVLRISVPRSGTH